MIFVEHPEGEEFEFRSVDPKISHLCQKIAHDYHTLEGVLLMAQEKITNMNLDTNDAINYLRTICSVCDLSAENFDQYLKNLD